MLGASPGRFLARCEERVPKFFLFLFDKWRTILPISRGTNFTTFEHNNVNRCRHVNFRNRILKCSRFSKKKRKNCFKNFQVLRFKTVITPQWLQIAGNSLPTGPYTGCLDFIFKVSINLKFSSGLYAAHKKGTYPNFWHRPMSDMRIKNLLYSTVLVPPKRAIYWREADWIGNWK